MAEDQKPQKKRIVGEGDHLFYSDGRASLAARVWCFLQFRYMSDEDYEAGTALEWSCTYRGDNYFDIKKAKVVLDPPSRGKEELRRHAEGNRRGDRQGPSPQTL